MFKRRPSRDPSPEINIANLIDIVFCILIVFMVSAPLMTQGIKVDLPKAKAKSLDEKKTIHITITKDREIVIDDNPSSPLTFAKDFRRIWTGDPDQVVIVNSDEKVPYGFVMKIVGFVQNEGAQKLGFLTDPNSPLPKTRKSQP